MLRRHYQSKRVQGGSVPLEESLPGDIEIRALLKKRLISQQNHGILIEELGLLRHRVRLDLAVVGPKLHGYEIKSDRDSLKRLAHQVEIYSQILDRATLVVGERHIESAMGILPEWWEVILVRPAAEGFRLVKRRSGRVNPNRSPRAIAELLWREDALQLLDHRGAARGLVSKPRAKLWDRLCELLTVDEIAAEVRARLKARAELEFVPQSL